MKNFPEILIFKTNIQCDEDVNVISSHLDGLSYISKWNIDTDDIDKVLRIEATGVESSNIIHLVKQAGFFCEELQD